MAHPMYGINELLKKYQLAAKAFARTEAGIEAFFFGLGGEAAVLAGPKLIIETIDRNIDGTDAEKQALIIGTMYSMSAAALAEDKESFETQYGPETKAVMDDLQAAMRKSAEDKSTVNVSRILAVLGICTMAPITSILADNAGAGNPVPAQQLQEMKDGFLAEEKKFLPNLNSPRLAALYQKTKNDFFILLEQPPSAQPKNHKNHGKPRI